MFMIWQKEFFSKISEFNNLNSKFYAQANKCIVFVLNCVIATSFRFATWPTNQGLQWH